MDRCLNGASISVTRAKVVKCFKSRGCACDWRAIFTHGCVTISATGEPFERTCPFGLVSRASRETEKRCARSRFLFIVFSRVRIFRPTNGREYNFFLLLFYAGSFTVQLFIPRALPVSVQTTQSFSSQVVRVSVR